MEDQITAGLYAKSNFSTESVILIKWSEKSKITAQGGSAQGNKGVESPQMVNIEKTVIFEE